MGLVNANAAAKITVAVDWQSHQFNRNPKTAGPPLRCGQHNMTSNTQKLTHSGRVTTWQSPRGLTLDICTTCEARIEREGLRWPKDDSGQEYCEVSFGQHSGLCAMEGAR